MERCEDESDYIITLLRLYRTYTVKVSALYKPLFKVVTDCSDDTYGDTLDSYPLVYGENRFNDALEGCPFDDDIVRGCYASYSKIYNGENYVASNIFDQILDQAYRITPDPAHEKEEPIKKPFTVSVTRTSTRSIDIPVYAFDEEEAFHIASEKATNRDFNQASENEPEYNYDIA